MDPIDHRAKRVENRRWVSASGGSDATVTGSVHDVQLSKPVPGLSMRTVTPNLTTGESSLRLRITYSLAEDNGSFTAGSTSEVLLILDAAGVTTVFAELNSTELLGTPSPEVTIADASRVFDAIAASYQPN